MSDYYKGIKGLYFWQILKTVSQMTDLSEKRVLDFGCGFKKLKYYVPHAVGYDIDPAFTEIADWRQEAFDVVIVNEVFYEMSESEVKAFLNDLYQINSAVKLIVGIARKSWLNRLGAFFLQSKAHEKYQILPDSELEIIKEMMTIRKKKSVWGLCDIYLFEFIL